MRFQLFVLLLLSVSLVSASPDCWRLTEEPKCEYISFENCTDIFYDDFLDCERDRLEIEYKPKNIIQVFVEKSFPDYESESLTKLYDYTNMQIFLVLLFCYLLYWIFNNG